jgi:hypothetical protein
MVNNLLFSKLGTKIGKYLSDSSLQNPKCLVFG